jgi:antitoxin component YwqK of YwqJK toxin-antitoxin module
MKILVLLLTLLALASCYSEDGNEQKVPEENLIEDKNGLYKEYYPGKKQVKFRGEHDDEHRRNNKWSFYSEEGKELSITFFKHGLRDGHTIVKYPNGTLRYVGEYSKDQQVGVWKMYGEDGQLTQEKDYGYPAE